MIYLIKYWSYHIYGYFFYLTDINIVERMDATGSIAELGKKFNLE